MVLQVMRVLISNNKDCRITGQILLSLLSQLYANYTDDSIKAGSPTELLQKKKNAEAECKKIGDYGEGSASASCSAATFWQITDYRTVEM